MKKFFVDENSAGTIEEAINLALKSIGNLQIGIPFGVVIRFADTYYFGIGCYSLQGISFGRLFKVNEGTVISYRNSNSENAAIVNIYTMSGS